MSREKQIKELRGILWGNPYVSMSSHQADMLAQYLHNESYSKQSEGEWVDNHCTNCGMTPIGEETWTRHGETPPRFELFMSFCPNCGAKMKGV